MKTRTEKWKEKRYLIKRESSQVEYIINSAIEDNANDERYREVFDEITGNPLEQLDKLMPQKKQKTLADAYEEFIKTLHEITGE